MTSTSHQHFCFIGQPSFHHQARPLTHPPLQWRCAAADTAGFIMCLSVPVCVCPIVLSIHPSMAFPEYHLIQSNVKWNGWRWISTVHALQNRDLKIPVFDAHSIIHHVFIHSSLYSSHSFMHLSVHPWSSFHQSIAAEEYPSLLPKRLNPRRGFIFSFFKATILDAISGRPALFDQNLKKEHFLIVNELVFRWQMHHSRLEYTS